MPGQPPRDKAWTIIEYLEHEARDYITNKSEAERDTDEKVFALIRNRVKQDPCPTTIQNQKPKQRRGLYAVYRRLRRPT